MATISIIDPETFEVQNYEDNDVSLIGAFSVSNKLLTPSDYIEFNVYTLSKELLLSDPNFTSYTVQNNSQTSGSEVNKITISPSEDLIESEFEEGDFITYYNFLSKVIGDDFNTLYIKDISSDRTEIRLSSTVLSNLDLVEKTNNFITFRNVQDYFVDFFLNFGNNELLIANNIKLENETSNSPTILIKLLEPLPSTKVKNTPVWVVRQFSDPVAYQVSFPPKILDPKDTIKIQGPNYNLPIKDEINNSSPLLSFNNIITNAPSSSVNQIKSLIEEKSINISVDYTNFNDFIHFSSLQTRLENFYYKIELIESSSKEIYDLSLISNSNTTITLLENNISNIIENFDKFEYFMYYDSGSTNSWPKSNTEPPYILYPTTSSQVLTWFGSDDELSSNYGGLILSASNFDNANPNELKKAIPEYLRENPANKQYDLFVDMVAQYYDNVWLYTKDITQKYNADNRLDFGISKDLVSEAIRDFGLKLYQNNFSNNDLYTAFLGITPSGSLFPFPEMTSTLPSGIGSGIPIGMEFVNTLISASNDIIPLDDVNKSLYKRIYHNIPYLLKSKGTISGLRALITSYGIPDTILKISEFGGKDQVNANDYDLYFDNFNYAFDTKGTNYISTPWVVNFTKFPGVIVRNPRTIQFRFKPESITNGVSPFGLSNLSQSLWHVEHLSIQSSIVLEYTGSGLISSSLYSGSNLDPYYQYGTLKYINTSGESASISLPFFDGGWWSVMATVDSNNSASLYAGNKIYNGKDGTTIGYFSSSKAPADGWGVAGGTSFFAKSRSGYSNFSGSLQEIRYYAPTINENVFKDYVMNPLSFEGNSTNSAPNELIFRADLGSELDISNILTGTSIHPKVTGSWDITSSFANNSNYIFNDTASYKLNRETFFLDQPAVGIKNRINDKIRFEDNVIPSGNTLSALRRIVQETENSSSYTNSINYLEAAFSPQNQINDDIIGQMGHFNIGDYVGDPRQRFEKDNKYKDLNNLSEEYFKKYIKNYDLKDFIRLIKFFDNSLFKMIKDFIPARTSLASGLVIKQHLLERNKYPQPEVSKSIESILSGSIDMVEIKGGPGGMLNIFNSTSTSPSGSLGDGPNNRFDLTQSFEETFLNLSGSATKTSDSQDEFYDGEFSGSTLIITNGELNPGCDIFKNLIPKGANVFGIRSYNYIDDDISKWIQSENQPTKGYIQTFYSEYISPYQTPNPGVFPPQGSGMGSGIGSGIGAGPIINYSPAGGGNTTPPNPQITSLGDVNGNPLNIDLGDLDEDFEIGDQIGPIFTILDENEDIMGVADVSVEKVHQWNDPFFTYNLVKVEPHSSPYFQPGAPIGNDVYDQWKLVATHKRVAKSNESRNNLRIALSASRYDPSTFSMNTVSFLGDASNTFKILIKNKNPSIVVMNALANTGNTPTVPNYNQQSVTGRPLKIDWSSFNSTSMPINNFEFDDEGGLTGGETGVCCVWSAEHWNTRIGAASTVGGAYLAQFAITDNGSTNATPLSPHDITLRSGQNPTSDDNRLGGLDYEILQVRTDTCRCYLAYNNSTGRTNVTISDIGAYNNKPDFVGSPKFAVSDFEIVGMPSQTNDWLSGKFIRYKITSGLSNFVDVVDNNGILGWSSPPFGDSGNSRAAIMVTMEVQIVENINGSDIPDTAIFKTIIYKGSEF